MRNLKLGLFSMLCAVFMFGITTAFDINVGPESYYGTLTLNTGYFKYGNGNTGILIGYDGASNGPSIKIGKRNANAYSGIELLGGQSKILVNQICDASNGNCKQVSQLSIGNEITINGQNGQNYICTKTNDNTLECSTAKLGTDFNNNNGRIRYCTYTPNSGLNCNTQIQDPGNGTVTINQGGTQVGSFTLNQTNTATINLATGTTPGNGTVTINQGGTQVGRFTLNQTSSATINLATGGGGGGDSLWTTGNNNILKPESTNYKILIGEDGAIYPNILISKSGGSRNEWSIDGGCTYYTHNGNQTIEYSQQLVIGKRGLMCSDGKVIAINTYGLGIGLPANNTYALRVAGGTEMNVLKVKDSATIGSHVFNDKVGININPNPNGPKLQVNGGIKVGSDGHSTCMNGTIDYTGNNFYGCVNGSWKKFTMSNALQN